MAPTTARSGFGTGFGTGYGTGFGIGYGIGYGTGHGIGHSAPVDDIWFIILWVVFGLICLTVVYFVLRILRIEFANLSNLPEM